MPWLRQCQFLHVFSLNELADISNIYAKELSRIRGIDPANHSTFSNANRTRNPEVMEKFFWMMYNHLRSTDAEFVHCKHKGKLSRFKLRNIFAIDSTTLKLAYWCINWAKHRQNKAAVKVHIVANVASRLPHFCVYGKANEHDSKKEEILFESLNAGDIGILELSSFSWIAMHFYVVNDSSKKLNNYPPRILMLSRVRFDALLSALRSAS